jgi:uncharacterized membrane protein
MWFVINPSVVSVSITPELSVAAAAILLTPRVLLKLERLWHVLVPALLVITVWRITAVVSLLVEAKLVPVLFGLHDRVWCILEGISKILVASQVAFSLKIGDSWSTLGVSALEVAKNIVVITGVLDWVSCQAISNWVEVLTLLLSFLGQFLEFFGAHLDVREGNIRESLEVALSFLFGHVSIAELVSLLLAAMLQPVIFQGGNVSLEGSLQVRVSLRVALGFVIGDGFSESVSTMDLPPVFLSSMRVLG